MELSPLKTRSARKGKSKSYFENAIDITFHDLTTPKFRVLSANEGLVRVSK